VPTTLLAIDDSVTMRKVLEMTFAGEDFRVLTADSGDAAFAKLRSDRPTIVLCDISLEGPGGYAICAKIKSDNPTVAVLLMASKQQPYDAHKGQSARADDFIEKPFDTQQLIDKVKRLATRPAEAAAPAARPVAPGQPPMSMGPATQPGVAPSPGRPPVPAAAPMAPARAPGPPGGPPPAPAHRPAAGVASGIGRGTLAYGQYQQQMQNPGGAAPGGGAGFAVPATPTGGPQAGFGAAPQASSAAFGASPQAPSAASGFGAPRQAPQAAPPAAPPPAAAPAPVHGTSPGMASPVAAVGGAAPAAAAIAAVSSASNGQLAAKLQHLGLTDTQVSGVLALSREVIEKVVWEVVPVLAETMIREELKRLTSD
jgi:CheY-like chemotaxis protein